MSDRRIAQGLADYRAALSAGDARAAYEVIDGLIDAGLSYEELCEDVVRPALYEIGDLWEAGQLTVADEHVASAISDTILACIGPFTSASIESPQRVLVCCSEASCMRWARAWWARRSRRRSGRCSTSG